MGGGIAVWENQKIRNSSLPESQKMVGAISAFNRHVLKGVGWHRIAEIKTKSVASCDIMIERSYNTAYTEYHKIALLSAHLESTLKSIADRTLNEASRLITKIRIVRNNAENMSYIDIFYNSATSVNDAIFILNPCLTVASRLYWIVYDEDKIVPETAGGETIGVSMDLGINTWMGEPL